MLHPFRTFLSIAPAVFAALALGSFGLEMARANAEPVLAVLGVVTPAGPVPLSAVRTPAQATPPPVARNRPVTTVVTGTNPNAATETGPITSDGGAAAAPAPQPLVYIREYRVQGGHLLSPVEIENAVYPYLGPGRTQKDMSDACEALTKAYEAKGFKTCSVQLPPQSYRKGVVFLEVSEVPVGNLRVKGAKYFLPDAIIAKAQSMAQGKVLNFNEVEREIVALNQQTDRKVTPSISQGLEPGTVDVDLNVEDKLPLHGNVELNNRYNADTTPLRLNASVNYDNLWQAGHSIGFSTQISPENGHDVQVYSGYYIWRLAHVDWLNLMFQGTKQDSNVNTLGALNVAGRGEVIGARALVTLPHTVAFYQSLSFGMDYKHFNQGVKDILGATEIHTPISYYPISANYSATWLGKPLETKEKNPDPKAPTVYQSTTELNTGVTLHLRGMGSSSAEFISNRFKADGDFIYLRGDLSRTEELPGGFQAYAKVQGQVSDQPLINSEQFSGGGLNTVRGYLESEVLGDNAILGTVELRSPSLLGWLPAKDRHGSEWRIYAFADAGRLTIRSPLPEQQDRFELASYGIGSRIRIAEHFNGSIDAAVPLTSQTDTNAHDVLVTFRLWADF